MVAERGRPVRAQAYLRRCAPEGVPQDQGAFVDEALAGAVERVRRPHQLGIHVLGDDLAVESPAAQEIAPGEGLSGDRVPWRDGREKLMDRGHVGRRV